ncbi:MAG: alpha/beta hydrolase [Chloroflexi bacterium]|nr:alpha/beta hydrolase [Chloroflexota bacterium]MDA1272074.1 alpha/beta hydrolase [Chloroflexota bacterium]
MASEPTVRYDPDQVYEVSVQDLEYQPGMTVRVYQPKGPGPFPALLDVHGGVWSTGDRTNAEVLDRGMAESGMVVAAIDFRLAPAHPFPAQVADVNLATRWLKSKAGDLNADPSTVGSIGSSSGGHTALLSAMRPGHPDYCVLDLPGSDADATVDYVLACWPIVDPFARYQFAAEIESARLIELSEGYFLTTDAMKEGNPFQILRRGEDVVLPPVMIIQGEADRNLPVPVTEEFVAAYREAGGTIEYEGFAGMPHGFGYTAGPETDRAIGLMKRFVARCLG